MKKIVLLKCILCIFTIPSYAQIDNRKIDSLIILAKLATNVDSSELIIDQIISESNAINYRLGVVDGILLRAGNLHNSDRFDESLRLLQKWKAYILGSKNNVRTAQFYAQQANSYNSLYFTEKSRQNLKEAKRYAEKIVDDNPRYNNLAKIYMILSNTFETAPNTKSSLDSTLFYRKKAYEIQAKIIGGGALKTGAVIQESAIGDIYLKAGKLDSAKRYFAQSIQTAQLHQLEKFVFPAFLGLGDIHLREKNLDSALYYYTKASTLAIKIENTRHIKDSYFKLSTMYALLGDTGKSVAYLKKHSNMADSLSYIGRNATKASSDIIIAEEAQSQHRKTKYYIAAIGCFILLLILLIYILITLNKRHIKTVEQHKLEQEKLYEKLGQFKAEAIADKINDKDLREVISLAMNNDPIFLIKFKELHPVFIQKLIEICPTLATSDLSICAQLRLGFYTKEIARYTGASVRAVEGKKHRIRKKLNIPTTDDINVWMIKL
jgi:tetratricopeptide (TPR) repeat protein